MYQYIFSIKRILLLVSLVCAVHHNGHAQIIAADSAADPAYTSNWNNGSNGGYGWNAWEFSVGANTGFFIGNPANDGMQNIGIGTTAFGMYATGSEYANARRKLKQDMQPGDELSFYWAMNFDANGGSKGFDFLSGTTVVYSVSNEVFTSVIATSDNPAAIKNYGTKPILVTMKRINLNEYDFSMTGRDGVESFSSRYSSPLPINGLNFTIGFQKTNDGRHNIYFNHFKVTSVSSSLTDFIKQDVIRYYPNPVRKEAVLNVDLNHIPGRYSLSLYNLSGALISRQNLIHPGAKRIYSIQLPSNTAPGMYIAEIRSGKSSQRFKLIIE